MMWRPMSEDMVREAFFASGTRLKGIKDLRAAYADKLKGARIAYKGGDAAIEFLIRKEGETALKWNDRRARFRDVPVVSPIVNVHAALIYAIPPDRTVYLGKKPMGREEIASLYLDQLRANGPDVELEIPNSDPVSSALQSWYSDTMRENHAQKKMLDGMQRAYRDGYAAAKVVPSLLVKDEPVTFTGVSFEFADKCEDILPIYDPDEPGVLVAVIETRNDDADDHGYRLWVPGYDGPALWRDVDDELNPTGPWEEWWQNGDAYASQPPFVFLNVHDGSWLGAAVLYQRALINQTSARDNILKAQGFAQAWSQGEVFKDESVNSKGQRVVRVGEWNIVELKEGGSLNFALPGAPIDQHDACIESTRAEVFRAYNMPASFWKDAGVVDRPMALRLSWTPTLLDTSDQTADAIRFERQLAEQVMTYASVFRDEVNRDGYEVPDFDPKDVVLEVKFREDPLPTDRTEARTADRSDYDAGLMTAVEYVYRRPGNENLDPEVVARKVYRAEQEKTRKNTAAVSALFAQTPPPLGGGV